MIQSSTTAGSNPTPLSHLWSPPHPRQQPTPCLSEPVHRSNHRARVYRGCWVISGLSQDQACFSAGVETSCTQKRLSLTLPKTELRCAGHNQGSYPSTLECLHFRLRQWFSTGSCLLPRSASTHACGSIFGCHSWWDASGIEWIKARDKTYHG